MTDDKSSRPEVFYRKGFDRFSKIHWKILVLESLSYKVTGCMSANFIKTENPVQAFPYKSC